MRGPQCRARLARPLALRTQGSAKCHEILRQTLEGEFVVAHRTTGFRPRQMEPVGTPRASSLQSRPQSNQSATAAAWLVLFGLIIPTAELHPKITPARIGILLLIIPALRMLLEKGRRMVVSDLFACAAAVWMAIAFLHKSGLDGLFTHNASEAFDFFGAYVVARAFFLGSTALGTFIRVLKILLTAAVILGLADTIYGHLFIHNIFASIVGSNPPGEQFREGLIRANSSFDHAILFGAFCAVVAAIFLYSERSALRRAFWVGLCCLGVILSLTSAALMSIFISLAAYTYDRLLGQYRWRWTAFCMLLAAMVPALFLIHDHPIRWTILRLTLEPQHGYYRLLIWDQAMPIIAQYPWLGSPIQTSVDEPTLGSVDCVWLVRALDYGIPAIVFLLLANVAAFLPAHESFNSAVGDPYRMRTGFTMALIMFMFIGLTVHYWSYMWIFWGLCIGIRGSLREQSIVANNVPYRGVAALAT